MAKYDFKFKPSYYTTQGAETLMRKDNKGMRSEYTRMRDIAQKRIKRLGKDFDWTKTFTKHENGIPKLSELDPRDLPKAFKELASFIKWSGSTLTGQRAMQEKTSATLSKAIGGEKVMKLPESERPVNSRNYQRVIKILEKSRKLKTAMRVYDSKTIAELADATLSLSDDEFDTVLDNLEKFLENVEEVEVQIEKYRDKYDTEEIDMAEFMKETGW